MIAFSRASNYGTNTSVTFTGGNNNGNLIVIGIFQPGQTTDQTLSVTDTEGNTYVRVAGAEEADSFGSGYYVFYYAYVTNGTNGLGPDNHVSVSGFLPNYNIVACEYSGVVSSNPVDVSGGSGDSGSHNLSYGINLTLSGELIVSMASCQNSTPQNWSGLSGTARAGSASSTVTCFYDSISPASGNNTITATDDGENSYPAGFSVSFLPSSQGIIPGPRSTYGVSGKRTFGNLVGY